MRNQSFVISIIVIFLIGGSIFWRRSSIDTQQVHLAQQETAVCQTTYPATTARFNQKSRDIDCVSTNNDIQGEYYTIRCRQQWKNTFANTWIDPNYVLCDDASGNVTYGKVYFVQNFIYDS